MYDEENRKIKMKNKKASHVGMVLSFVIFITFLVVLFVLLQPATRTKDKTNVLKQTEAKIINASASDLKIISLIIDQTNPQDCVQLEDFFTQTGVSKKIIVKGSSGNVLDSKVSEDDSNDLLITRQENIFIKVYESDEFGVLETGTTTSCQPLNEGENGYIIGSIKTEERVFEAKILKLLDDYKNDYDNLKVKLRIASGNEFGIGFEYNNGTIIDSEEKEVSVSVFSSKVPIQYVDKKAYVESGFLHIRVW